MQIMIGFLLDKLNSIEVTKKIIYIKETLRENGLSFASFFPVILTDRGQEFSDVFTIENNLDGKPETKLFFCDPCQSSQKPNVEKNHTLFRDIVPKDLKTGKNQSFNSFTQDTVNLIFSHVNSTARKVLGGKTPHEMLSFLYSKALHILFNIVEIHPQDVIQSPLLLK